jgi:hypothetical protein
MRRPGPAPNHSPAQAPSVRRPAAGASPPNNALPGRDFSRNSRHRQVGPQSDAGLEAALWVEEKRRQRSTVPRQPQREQSAMLGHPPSVRPRDANDQPRTHGSGGPAAICRDPDREPSLPVERADEFVHVDDGCLELDHNDRTCGRVPGEKVDDASLAVDRERDLPRCGPTRLASDPGRDPLAQCRMPGADDAFELATGRSRQELQADAKLRRDSAKGGQRHSIHVAVLQARHDGRRNAGLLRKIALAKTALDASSPERQTELKVVHRTPR